MAKKKLKRRFIVLPIVLGTTLMVASIAFSSVYFTLLYRYPGTHRENPFNETDAFDISKIATLEKQKDKDFVILNLADVQMCDLEDIKNFRTLHAEIDELVSTYHPDLITLTGDQTWSNENLISLTSLISWLDGYQTPWAPIFGNHDYGNERDSAVASQQYCCDLYERSKYCLFDRGPSNLGTLGNYVVNIVEEEHIIHSLYFLDLGYEHALTEGQSKWFAWNADGIKASNNNAYAPGTVFTHKELPGSLDAYLNYCYTGQGAEGDVIVHMGFAWVEDTGFEDLAKSHGVYDFISGHEHNNNYTIHYEGARYTFAVKTGECVSYYEDENIYLNGGTTITISDEETPKIEHHYVERDKYKIK